jgi:hypothetical protein
MTDDFPPRGVKFLTNPIKGSVKTIRVALNEASSSDSLHIMIFMRDISGAESRYIQSIVMYAKAPPKKMAVIINGGRQGLARHGDLQSAISDPRMRGTIVISHGSPQGKIWERHGVAICPAGFEGNAQYPCALTLKPRSAGGRPQWVLLAGCHMGSSESAWRQTFGNPLMLDGSQVYTTGGASSVSGSEDDTESTIPKLKAVMDWLQDHKSAP